jgi:hypothetical protein
MYRILCAPQPTRSRRTRWLHKYGVKIPIVHIIEKAKPLATPVP